ncbi:MAG: pitrilysin family protein [Candidatus Melainabacteria bacterium]|nr:pitrilysin family protein [Candidatus Melainabacteria bacterium]
MPHSETFTIPFLKEPAHRVVFENGHTLLFVPRRGPAFNVSTWVKTGSVHENDQNSGVSHFLEHLMFKGTERFKPGEFDRRMESRGAVINAATWKDFTFYYVTAPKGTAPNGEGTDNLNEVLDLHADMLLHSTLPDAEIGPAYNPDDPHYAGEKRERAVVIEEIGMREDQPWTRVFNAVNHRMYPTGHPYQRDVIGTRQIIGQIPRAEIEHYYKTWYSAPNMTTIVVGDFDQAYVVERVQTYFDFHRRSNGVAPGKRLQVADVPLLPERPADTTLQRLEGDYQTHFVMMAFHAPPVTNLRESIALDVASYILGEGHSSRLVQTLLEQVKKPNYNSVSCGQSTFSLGNTFYIQGNFLSSDVTASLGELTGELERFLHDAPMTQDEFERAVKKLKVDFADTSETASGIAEALGDAVTVANSLGHYTQYLDTLASLDLETVHQVARRYLAPSQAYTTVLVPKQGSARGQAPAEEVHVS